MQAEHKVIEKKSAVTVCMFSDGNELTALALYAFPGVHVKKRIILWTL